MAANEFMPIFLDEAVEILDNWEAACLKLESDSNPETINALFRAAHNLKGSAKSVGLEHLGGLIHLAEDVITRLKNNELEVSANIIAVLLDCQKQLADWIEALRSDADSLPDTGDLRSRLASYHVQTKAVEENAGFALFDDPPPTSQPPKPQDLGTILVTMGKATQEQIEIAVAQQNRKLGEVLVQNGAVSEAEVHKALELQKQSGQKHDETIRVSLRKLDTMIRLIGELTIQLAIIKNAKDSASGDCKLAEDAIGLSHKVTQDLQSEAMSLRMQPLENLFQRMERVCRDVARQQGKPLQVVLIGTDVELDKTVIERIKDPPRPYS